MPCHPLARCHWSICLADERCSGFIPEQCRIISVIVLIAFRCAYSPMQEVTPKVVAMAVRMVIAI